MKLVADIIDAMERYPQIEMEPEHLFAPGMYARILRMPADSIIVSKLHKTEHFCLALTGRVTVVIGDCSEEVIAPHLMRTLPGTQRLLYVHEDATWIAFYPTSETDIQEIEQRLIAQSPDDPELLQAMSQCRYLEVKR